MTCNNCETARTFPEYRMFDPACLYCGARLIQLLGKLPIGVTEVVTRRRQVLADWMAHGHTEADLRRLAKGPLSLAPTGPAGDTESAHQPTQVKPLSVGRKSKSR